MSPSARHAEGWRAEFRIPFSQLRYDPSSASGLRLRGRAQVAHATETSTWPLLAKSASGYVSSFGDLNGLAFSGGQKRLELTPYALSEVTTSPVDSRQSAERRARCRRLGRPRPEIPRHVGTDADGDRQSRTSGRSKPIPPSSISARSRRSSPSGGRSSSRDPATSSSGSTAATATAPACSIPAASAARRTGSPTPPSTGTRSSRSTRRSSAPPNSPDGSASSRSAASTPSPAASRPRSRPGPGWSTSTTPVEPASSYSVARVSREFANNSRVSFMLTNTYRRLTDELRFLPSSATTGGIDTDCPPGRRRLQPDGLLGRQRRARQRGRDRSPSAQQCPQLSAARRDASRLRSRQRAARRARRVGQHQQDQRPAHAVHVWRVRTRRRAST